MDTGFLSCTMASPCHELAWELVADTGIEFKDQNIYSTLHCVLYSCNACYAMICVLLCMLHIIYIL